MCSYSPRAAHHIVPINYDVLCQVTCILCYVNTVWVFCCSRDGDVEIGKFLSIIIEIDVTYPSSVDIFIILVINLIPARLVTLIIHCSTTFPLNSSCLPMNSRLGGLEKMLRNEKALENYHFSKAFCIARTIIE